jgi:uncharacterized protein
VTTLLDANVLIALVDPDHVHHSAAGSWFSSTDVPFATCPITQGSLIRHLFRAGHSPGDIGLAIDRIQGLKRHTFWSDNRPFDNAVVSGLIGHRQVTDAYLAHLTRSRKGNIATIDRALAAAHADVAVLVPVE